MKTTILSTLIIGGFMALGTTAMAQQSTMTKSKDMTSMDQQKVPRMMKKMDANSDKMVSKDEAKAAKNQMLYKNFDMADTSQDGMIDTSEFMAYQKNMKKMKGMKDEKMKGMKEETDSMNR